VLRVTNENCSFFIRGKTGKNTLPIITCLAVVIRLLWWCHRFHEILLIKGRSLVPRYHFSVGLFHKVHFQKSAALNSIRTLTTLAQIHQGYGKCLGQTLKDFSRSRCDWMKGSAHVQMDSVHLSFLQLNGELPKTIFII